MRKKHVLICGGAGFIGSHLCDSQLDQGHQVTVLDNLVTGRLINIEHLANHPNFNFINHDITLPLPGVGSVDEIYNLASPASPPDFEKMPIEILETSAIGHRNLLQLAKQQNCRVLLSSTSEVYGDPAEHPQRETYFGNVNPIGPRSCYDEAKRYAEALSFAYHRIHSVDIAIVRIFNTYGPRMRPEDGRVIPNFFSQALKGQPLTIFGDGKQTRSFCYVSDMVAGLETMMNSRETGPFNIGSQDELSILDMAETVNQILNSDKGVEFFPRPQDDPKLRRPDTSVIKSKLGWQPKSTLRQGLQKTLDYFLQVHTDSTQKSVA